MAPATSSVKNVLASSGQPLDSATRQWMEPRFRQDFSRIRIHADPQAAESAHSIGAQAWTVGNHIAFGSGQFQPTHAAGQNLLAHELAHTVHARSEAAPHTVWRRRLPEAGDLSSTLPAGGTDLAAHEKGVIRLLVSTWHELTTAERAKVLIEAKKIGISPVGTVDLFAVLEKSTRDQLLQFVEIVRKVRPDVTLGDMTLQRTGPRPGTQDANNIALLLQKADPIYNAVASGSLDSDLEDIFGPSNVSKAKVKFANAKNAAHRLVSANKVFADRSGFSAEAGIGGASTSLAIKLNPVAIDSPQLPTSVETFVHESAHAGTSDVTDVEYINHSTFPKMQEVDKLNNAADYQIIANRVLEPHADKSFKGPPPLYTPEKFVPAGPTPPAAGAAGSTGSTGSGGSTGPAGSGSGASGGASPAPSGQPAGLPQKTAAAEEAKNIFRRAWTASQNIHGPLTRAYQHPAEWSTLDLSTAFSKAEAGVHFSQCLPFWSKVERMTIHERTGINPSSPTKATRPVTEIDLAQSEAVTRKLSRAQWRVPEGDAKVTALEKHALPTQVPLIAKGVRDEAEVLVSLVRSQSDLGEITGDVSRDVRAVLALEDANKGDDWARMLKKRSPADFKD